MPTRQRGWYPSDRRRWFRLESAELADRTAELTDREFRAFILLLAWANETQAQKRGDWIHIAKSRLSLIAPTRQGLRGSSDEVVTRLCIKMAWDVQRSDARLSIHIRNYSQYQGYAPTELPRDSHETPTTTPTPTPKKKESADRASPSGGPVEKEDKSNKPDVFHGTSKDEILTWAQNKGINIKTLDAAMEIFREWAPLKMQRRTGKQWVAAFKRICGDAVDEGKIGAGYTAPKVAYWKGHRE